jgi:hypothetical protein
MAYKAWLGAGLTGVAMAGAAAALAQAGGGQGTATYWMTAETMSGMAAMGAGGGNGSAMISALMGRGAPPSHVRNLTLQLGTGRRPAGEPSAEHLPPPALQAGASLPLVTPQAARPSGPSTPWQGQVERPRGRMLIYWGCGERARPGQPVVVDFATLTSGKVPPAFANANFRPMTPPNPSAHATYGEWPNQRSQTRVPANGSLVGAHVVRGNYTPEIRFNLAPGQDFLAPVRLTANSAGASGSVPLVWSAVPGARAWFASTVGSTPGGDLIMWSSSETQMAAMAMDYLPESELQRLIAQKVLLPAAADRCTVPSEVAGAAPQSMLSLVAFGPEANFSHPVRPARAPASWRPEWTVKLRTKSTHMGMLGMSLEEMMGGRGNRGGDSGAGEAAQSGKKKKKDRIREGLGKILGQ